MTNTYTLPYIEQITNENLLYSTENSARCSVVTYMGKKSIKRGDKYTYS